MDAKNILVESLWRIYNTGKPIKLTKDDVKARVSGGKIKENRALYNEERMNSSKYNAQML